MAETPHDPDAGTACGCRACSLNRRRLGTPRTPVPEPELAARPPDPAARPPDRPSRPEPAPRVRIGYANVKIADLEHHVHQYRLAVKAEARGVVRRRRAVRALADIGLSVRAIAERVDLDPQTVHRWTRDVPLAEQSGDD